MKVLERKNAILLRKKGYSIKEIASSLDVSVSSASLWVRGVSLSENQMLALTKRNSSAHVVEARRKTRLSNEEKKRRSLQAESATSIKSILPYHLRLIGLALYWGEGGKTNHGYARISNSDPDIILCMMRFFREVCNVEEKKFRGQIHLHSALDVDPAEVYWSSISGIPRSQLFKTYIKKSVASKGKRKTLPFGTFDICVPSTKLFFEIIGQIDGIKKRLK